MGRFLGSLKSLSAVELGTKVVAEAIHRAGVPIEAIEEVIMGNVLSAGLGQNPARQVALGAGLPPQVAALNINKVCGSGLKAVSLAWQAIRLGDVEIAVAGGMESMTNAPYLLSGSRQGYRMGHSRLLDSMIHDGLWDADQDFHMGCTAEVVAEKYAISRQKQDEYALRSHQQALAAMREKCFGEEILPLEITTQKGEILSLDRDEGPREGVSLEKLSRLEPIFQENGTVTAGNASQISDGAAALMLASENAIGEYDLKPMARIVACASSGVEPRLVMMAPVEAVQLVKIRAGWEDDQVELFEINEAFAVQSLALVQEIPLQLEQLNIYGGAIALGHPIGASGARILITLLYALKGKGLKKGIAALCLGGGNAVAMGVELI